MGNTVGMAGGDMYRQSLVKTNQLEYIPSNNTFHILHFTYVTHDNPG